MIHFDRVTYKYLSQLSTKLIEYFGFAYDYNSTILYTSIVKRR